MHLKKYFLYCICLPLYIYVRKMGKLKQLINFHNYAIHLIILHGRLTMQFVHSPLSFPLLSFILKINNHLIFTQKYLQFSLLLTTGDLILPTLLESSPAHFTQLSVLIHTVTLPGRSSNGLWGLWSCGLLHVYGMHLFLHCF